MAGHPAVPYVRSGGTTSEQIAIAAKQRGANRQPGGGLRRSGGVPGITASVLRSVAMFGKAASSRCVYGWRGRRKISSTDPPRPPGRRT